MTEAANRGQSRERALRSVLEDAAGLLESVRETFWSSKLRSAAEALDIAEVRSWYGGTGSFNDLVIATANGHNVPREREAFVNAKLEELRCALYEVVTQMKR